MEEIAFKKDKTPYLVFACRNCQQFSYVKTSQKTKKCLRCGRSHQVKNVILEGEIVRGITLAVNTVKRKQNELAVPEFRSQSDFVIDTKNIRNKNYLFSLSKDKSDIEPEITHKFEELLLELNYLYGKFPVYMIEIIAEDSGISSQELSFLIKSFKKKGFLIPVNEEEFYYKISQNL